MPEPILSLGDLEPDRPLVAINRKAPDGAWQRFKHRHLDVLLRWLPVRYVQTRELYPLRMPSEFGLEAITRIQSHQKEIIGLQEQENDPAALRRASRMLRDISGLILDAPGNVLDDLPDAQHIRLLMAFPAAVTGQLPTETAPENPSTSDDSSPASAGSTPATAGVTG